MECTSRSRKLGFGPAVLLDPSVTDAPLPSEEKTERNIFFTGNYSLRILAHRRCHGTNEYIRDRDSG